MGLGGRGGGTEGEGESEGEAQRLRSMGDTASRRSQAGHGLVEGDGVRGADIGERDAFKRQLQLIRSVRLNIRSRCAPYTKRMHHGLFLIALGAPYVPQPVARHGNHTPSHVASSMDRTKSFGGPVVKVGASLAHPSVPS